MHGCLNFSSREGLDPLNQDTPLERKYPTLRVSRIRLSLDSHGPIEVLGELCLTDKSPAFKSVRSSAEEYLRSKTTVSEEDFDGALPLAIMLLTKGNGYAVVKTGSEFWGIVGFASSWSNHIWPRYPGRPKDEEDVLRKTS